MSVTEKDGLIEFKLTVIACLTCRHFHVPATGPMLCNFHAHEVEPDNTCDDWDGDEV